jgi:hypothetical protein
LAPYLDGGIHAGVIMRVLEKKKNRTRHRPIFGAASQQSTASTHTCRGDLTILLDEIKTDRGKNGRFLAG